MEISPSFYGVSERTKLIKLNEDRIGIYKVIKSRIIQKDAVKILVISQQIKNKAPHLEVALITTHNICSKSIALLESENIFIEFID